MHEHKKCQSLPPWLWIWLALYIYTLPDKIELVKEKIISFLFPVDPIYTNMILIDRLKIADLPYLIPTIFVFLGVLGILFPYMRTHHVEKKYNLTENYPRIPAIIEVENFLKLHAPNLNFKTNLLSQSETVFIYPIGYRKADIAIFGKFIKSWRSDKESAQKILLHEIGHYRNGDTLILGAGSFFEYVFKHSISIIAFIFLVQIALVFIDLNDSITHNELVAKMFPTNALIEPIDTFFQTLGWFALPIAGIWSAELNADRFMLTSKTNSSENSLKVIGKLKAEKSLRQWLLSQITHPPSFLRRWMAVHSYDEKSILLYLFLFPLAHLFQLSMLLISAISKFIIVFQNEGINIQEFSEFLFNKALLPYIHGRQFTWLLFSIVILLWPLLAVYWVRFFSGQCETYKLDSYKSYLLCALVLFCVFVLSSYY